MKDYIIDFSLSPNIRLRGEGIIALQRDSDDKMEFVTRDVFNAVNTNENGDYSLNYVAFSCEDKIDVFEGKIRTNQEVPRLSIGISTIFIDIDSLSEIVREGYSKFEGEI